MLDVLVVIPFYQRKDQLDRCLSALARSTLAVETYVHDNTQNNLGYTKASNLGLRRAMDERFRYALLLNQDCYVEPNSIERLVAFMDRMPRCAISAPKQVAADDPDHIIHGGCTAAYPAGKHLVGRVSRGDCAASASMPWVNGACQLVRVESLFSTGLLDERFFLLGSDADICFTARARGWEVWYCAEATVHHETGGTSRKTRSLAALRESGTDQRHFRDKWLGTVSWELLKDVPPSAEYAGALMKQAHQAVTDGRPIQGEVLARRVLQTVPDHVDAHLLLGKLYLGSDLPVASIRHLEQAAVLAPTSPVAAMCFGEALLKYGYSAEAAGQYERALARGHDDLVLRNNLGVAYLRMGRRDDAIAQWRQVLSREPQEPNARKNLSDLGVRA